MKILPQTVILSPLFCYSRKRLFEEIAECASNRINLEAQKIISLLNDREKAGSTVFAKGIAIPHAVVENIPKTISVLSILDKPIAFNSIDADPQYVDIAWTVFISSKEQYDDMENLLTIMTNELSNQDLLNSLRLSRNENTKIQLIIEKLDLLIQQRTNAPEIEVN
ncbi:MAG: PTS sugar transporter subunit IIA [Succinivibrio sp.]|nr:PTS sugar transporter subunit IIA [Succinivibrio sp.]